MPILPPDGSEFVLVPRKWLSVLQSISKGPFLPLDFPVPIIVNSMVPDDEIWWGKHTKVDGCDNYEIIKKETIDNEGLKLIGISGDDTVDQPKLISTDIFSSNSPKC